MDFRFIHGLRQWMEQRNLLGDCDVIAVPGAAKVLADPQMPEDADFFMRAVGVGVSIHRVQKIILMNHMDCGAYGGARAFTSPDVEHQRYERDLRAAAIVLQERYPHIIVQLMLAALREDGTVHIQELPEAPAT